MNDMSLVIVPKSDQINADTLLGGPITITITRVAIRPGTEQPVSVYFDGDDGKPWKPCKSMCKVMVALWGPDANEYVGRSLTLYNDPKVLWGGMAVGGIRISHMSHIKGSATMALTATKGSKKPFTVEPLAPPRTATETKAPQRTFRELLAENLEACKTRAEVDAQAALPAVVKIIAEGPEDRRAMVKKLLDEAYARFHATAFGELNSDIPFGDEPADVAEASLHPDAAWLINQIEEAKDIHALEQLLNSAAVKAKARGLPEEARPPVALAETAAREGFKRNTSSTGAAA